MFGIYFKFSDGLGNARGKNRQRAIYTLVYANVLDFVKRFTVDENLLVAQDLALKNRR